MDRIVGGGEGRVVVGREKRVGVLGGERGSLRKWRGEEGVGRVWVNGGVWSLGEGERSCLGGVWECGFIWGGVCWLGIWGRVLGV